MLSPRVRCKAMYVLCRAGALMLLGISARCVYTFLRNPKTLIPIAVASLVPQAGAMRKSPYPGMTLTMMTGDENRSAATCAEYTCTDPSAAVHPSAMLNSSCALSDGSAGPVGKCSDHYCGCSTRWLERSLNSTNYTTTTSTSVGWLPWIWQRLPKLPLFSSTDHKHYAITTTTSTYSQPSSGAGNNFSQDSESSGGSFGNGYRARTCADYTCTDPYAAVHPAALGGWNASCALSDGSSGPAGECSDDYCGCSRRWSNLTGYSSIYGINGSVSSGNGSGYSSPTPLPAPLPALPPTPPPSSPPTLLPTPPSTLPLLAPNLTTTALATSVAPASSSIPDATLAPTLAPNVTIIALSTTLDPSPTSKPVSEAKCCKCSRKRPNQFGDAYDTTVYSCSSSGSCGYCRNYGGRRNAEKIPAAGACADGTGTIRSKVKACQAAFES